jgi:hypothetical protein
MSKLVLSAVLALAAFAMSTESFARDYGRGYHHRKVHRLYSHGPCVGGHRCNPDWPQWGFMYGPYRVPFSYNALSYNYPGFYNNHTFWERVQTQANYPVQY